MMPRNLVAVLAGAVLMIGFTPALAQADSAVPSLPSGYDQAYVADGDGNPTSDSVELGGGSFTLTGGLTITCTSTSISFEFADDGTGSKLFSISGCSVAGFPAWSVSIAAPSVGYRFGARFARDSVGIYVVFNASLSMTFGSGGPIPAGTYPASGQLTGTLSLSGWPSTMTTTLSGTLTGPLGSMSAGGTFSGSFPSLRQLIF